MISVTEARRLSMIHAPQMPPEDCAPAHAAGRVLANDIRAPFPLPPFDNSAMDGYAVCAADLAEACEASPISLELAGIIAAGAAPCDSPAAIADGASPEQAALQPGTTRQIFTGAMIPPGCDAVIRQEDVQITTGQVQFARPARLRENIRFAGEEIAKGAVVLPRGARINAAAAGVIASLGLPTVPVARLPRVAILITGSEIVADPGQPLTPGLIYDSNSTALAAALTELGIVPSGLRRISDDPAAHFDAIQSAAAQADVILVTGGVSVGKFDFVKEQSAAAGFEQLFWKVRQKPGKPLMLARHPQSGKILFGLPGNPASVLVCFYQYVRPALLSAMGAAAPELRRTRLPLANSAAKAAGLTHFLKGQLQPDGTVKILGGQGSHMMASFAQSDCLIAACEEQSNLEAGDIVEVHLLP